MSKVTGLDHNLSKTGIEVDPAKTHAVHTFPVPKTQRDMRSFLGLSNYYTRFVPNFSKIATPLHRLLQKESKFEWSDPCQSAFDTLKEALVTAPMLNYLDLYDEFILTTDASNASL